MEVLKSVMRQNKVDVPSWINCDPPHSASDLAGKTGFTKSIMYFQIGQAICFKITSMHAIL